MKSWDVAAGVPRHMRSVLSLSKGRPYTTGRHVPTPVFAGEDPFGKLRAGTRGTAIATDVFPRLGPWATDFRPLHRLTSLTHC